jgi:hypothetical protein
VAECGGVTADGLKQMGIVKFGTRKRVLQALLMKEEAGEVQAENMKMKAEQVAQMQEEDRKLAEQLHEQEAQAQAQAQGAVLLVQGATPVGRRGVYDPKFLDHSAVPTLFGELDYGVVNGYYRPVQEGEVGKVLRSYKWQCMLDEHTLGSINVTSYVKLDGTVVLEHAGAFRVIHAAVGRQGGSFEKDSWFFNRAGTGDRQSLFRNRSFGSDRTPPPNGWTIPDSEQEGVPDGCEQELSDGEGVPMIRYLCDRSILEGMEAERHGNSYATSVPV